MGLLPSVMRQKGKLRKRHPRSSLFSFGALSTQISFLGSPEGITWCGDVYRRMWESQRRLSKEKLSTSGREASLVPSRPKRNIEHLIGFKETTALLAAGFRAFHVRFPFTRSGSRPLDPPRLDQHLVWFCQPDVGDRLKDHR